VTTPPKKPRGKLRLVGDTKEIQELRAQEGMKQRAARLMYGTLEILLSESQHGVLMRSYVRKSMEIALSDEDIGTGFNRIKALAQKMGLIPPPMGPQVVPPTRGKKGDK
jgi:hypothetical protein